MATKKISELEEINQAENNDYLVVVDTSEGKNKKITKENFLKISALEEKISDLENNQLTASTQGTSIDINDSADYQVREMIPNGNVIQNGTTGKNKFAGADTTLNNGITFKKNSDGSYNITGSATAQANAYNYVDINNSGLVNGQTYTFWASQVLPAEFFVLIEAYNGTTWQRHAMNGLKDVNQSESQVINLTDTTRIRFALRVNEGTTINISNLKIQLESGSTATNFEKYTGGIASPSPQYEQPINSAGDNINLLENTYTTSGTQGGIAHTKNANGTMLLNGTATTTVFMILNTFILPAGTYILSGCPNGGSENGYRQDILVGNNVITRDFGSGGSFTLNESTSIQARIRIGSGTAINNLTFKPMIIKGSIVKQYSPYGMGSINEVISNKNLFNMDGKPSEDRLSSAGYTLKYNDDKTITINGTGTGAYKFLSWDLTLEAGTYIASGCPSGGSQNGYSFLINVGSSSYWDYGNGISFTLIAKTTIQVYPIRIGSTIPTFNNVTFKPMIRLASSSATSFVPHQEQNISIPCQQPMRSIGNVRDSFVKIDGVWYEKHVIGQVVLNGSESGWVERGNTSENYIKFRNANALPYDIKGDLLLISDYFVTNIGANNASYSGNAICGNSGNYAKWLHISIDNTIVNSVETFKTWLSTHNTEVIYQLAEPIYLECTEEQITALEQARTYKPVTHISSADVVPAYLGVTYVRDLETVINNLS